MESFSKFQIYFTLNIQFFNLHFNQFKLNLLHPSMILFILFCSVYNIVLYLNILYIYMYKAVISVCLFVCMSDHNSETPGLICLTFWLRKNGITCSQLASKILSWVGRLLKIKIIFHAKPGSQASTIYIGIYRY